MAMKYLIDEKNCALTIKDFLRKNSYSQNLIKRLKKIENGITVNGAHQNVTYVLKSGDMLALKDEDFENDVNEHLEPANIPIEIIYEDENITVVNKPANMPTHESLNNRGNSLANALAYRYRDKNYVFRATNRLDKDTSGVVITANSKYYAALLSNKIKKGLVEKIYVAIVDGELTGEGKINAPIDRIGESIIKREVRGDGEEAISRYKALATNGKYSLVLLTPVTGRTHQLRVHMAYIGHPIVADALYGKESDEISRQALHCLEMKIDESYTFYAPLAPDIQALCDKYFSEITL